MNLTGLLAVTHTCRDGTDRLQRDPGELGCFIRTADARYARLLLHPPVLESKRILPLPGYFVLGYLFLGAFFYIWGYPRIFSKTGRTRVGECQGNDNFASRHAAHAVQAVTFILNDIPRFTKTGHPPVRQIYERSVAQAFDLRHRFVTADRRIRAVCSSETMRGSIQRCWT